jgi:anti-sigma regulatory factor (Ser/Thr protein kinase)
MTAPIFASNEGARLSDLRRYKILDTDPEQGFDDLTLLASHICQSPIALITFIDADRQWFKSRVGVSITETPREFSFCSRAIEHSDLFIVPDATKDERFKTNPFVVSEPKIRFYAGAPFRTASGHALGTLCVLDCVPRQLTGEQLQALRALSRQVQAQLELRQNLGELKIALAERDSAEDERDKTMEELRRSLAHVQRLSGLIPACSTCRLNVTIPAEANAISPVVDGVLQIAREMKCAEGHEYEVDLALREALANAIVHGCNSDPSKKIECCVLCEGSSEIVVIVRDPGEGFMPEAVANPIIGENLYSTHGRGIYLINQLMDEVRFEARGSEIQMRKKSRSSNEQRGDRAEPHSARAV